MANLKRTQGRWVLQAGDTELALFVDLESGRMKAKDQNGNEDFLSNYLPNVIGATPTKEVFTSTASQTVFTVTGTPDNVDVWINGVFTQEYTLADSNVTLDKAPITGSEVVIRKYF